MLCGLTSIACRRTDFLVNEIQKDGTVLHLRKSNIEVPKEVFFTGLFRVRLILIIF